MTRKYQLTLLLSLIFVGFVVYTPHWTYPYPFHVDEWHHIAQALHIGAGTYLFSLQSAELGFQIFLYLLGSLVDLVTVYRFFPALWAIASASALVWVSYRMSEKNAPLAIAAVIAFASIKSNVNIIGLWFFTPLTFAIPFIYLYTYFITKGIAEGNRRSFLTGVGIAAGLLFFHAISVFFALPFLALYGYLHRKTLPIGKREIFLLCAVLFIGLLFAMYILQLPFTSAFPRLMRMLTFPYGWGVVEMQNSYTEFYSTTGILLAFLGTAYLIQHKKRRIYAWYLLWPATLIVMILIFRITGYSFLSPYQRNLYYLALSLPPLSAFGVYYGYFILRKALRASWFEQFLPQFVTVLICVLLYGLFVNYTTLPKRAELYRAITKEDYNALQFLANQPTGEVMAETLPSIAIYPITGHEPVAALAFDGKREVNDRFMYEENCSEKRNASFENPHVRYILSRVKLYCGWVQIYAKKRYVYQLQP